MADVTRYEGICCHACIVHALVISLQALCSFLFTVILGGLCSEIARVLATIILSCLDLNFQLA